MTQTDSPGGASPEGDRAYRAFISYSHRDKQHAAWLHRTVEAYRIPKKLVGKVTPFGPVPKRPAPIFRDRDELPAAADLGGELTEALRRSMFLVVICSRASAKSHWVEQEILQFKRMHGETRVLALIVDGTPYASNVPGEEADECFPQSLRFHLGPDGALSNVPAEPIAADLRAQADGRRLAQMKLIAGLTGLRLDELVQREAQRRNQRLMMVAGGAMAGMVVTGGLAVYANVQRIEADHQRMIAEKESAAARAASEFLVSTFELSNPATENPSTITARTILGRSAERARTELANQPEIQVRLIAALGRAYNNLGLLGDARSAIESSLPAIDKAGPDGVRALLVLAETYVRQGALDKAEATMRRADARLGSDLSAHPDLRALAAAAEGRIATSRSDLKAGVAAFDRSLAYYRQVPDAPPKEIAVTLNNRGLLLSDDGQFDKAEASLRESLAILRRTSGDTHLDTGRGWFALAQNSFNAGKLDQAEREIAEALRIERRVLDPDNPLLADTLSMQGQILQGRGNLAGGERALREAVAIYRKAFRGEPHYLVGIADVYLALIEAEGGRTDAALATLDDAKRNYDGSYHGLHPNHGDLLVNRAKILAKAGRMEQAHADCAAGIDILRKTLGADANFTKQMAAECGALGASRQAKL